MTSDDPPTPTLENLAAEQQGETPTIESLDEAPGEPLFSPGDTARLYALAAIAMSDPPGPWGMSILESMQDTAGCKVSPGTMYPALKALHAEGVLAKQALVKRKHYSIADDQAAAAELATYEARLRWWLELCRQARDQLDTDADA